jgi:hypothetical protein
MALARLGRELFEGSKPFRVPCSREFVPQPKRGRIPATDLPRSGQCSSFGCDRRRHTGTIAAEELGEFPEGLRDAADGEEVRVAAVALPRRCAGRPRAATRTTRTVHLGQGSMQLAAAFALSPVNLIPDFII